MKRRRLKRKVRIIINYIKIFFILAIFVFILHFILKLFHHDYILSISHSNNFLIVELNSKDDLYCSYDKEENYVKSELSKCILDYDKNATKLYIKDNNKILYSSEKDIFYNIEINTLYMALNDENNPFDYLIGDTSKIKYEIGNKEIIDFKDGKIISLKEGETTIKFKGYKEYTINVIVTPLLSKRHEFYDYKKDYLKCNKYSEEENDLLDKILKTKIENAGYKTRAGVVEAARFLTLDFPYRINYFYENGRQTTNKVDGEGRYYHIGLYLNESKYKDLTGSTYTKNKGTWGCSIYDYPAKRNIDNGLDCSGFVSWALLNGGFDVKDVGAGWSNDLDLTDYGKVEKVTSSLIKSDVIKVGDLLHSEKAGGHIGIIVGMDKEYYYIAQALWFDEIGVIITKREKNELGSEFPHVVLMDEYYINDGNLTNMW